MLKGSKALRVLIKGLLAGGVYVLLWILVLRYLFVHALQDGAMVVILLLGTYSICRLLLINGVEGWGWSYCVYVLFSFFLNLILFFHPQTAAFLHGLGGGIADGLALVSLWRAMAVYKGVILLLMLLTVLPPDRRAGTVSEKEARL